MQLEFWRNIGRESGDGGTSRRFLPTPTATSYGTNQGGGAGRVGPIRPSLQTMAKTGELTSYAEGSPARTYQKPVQAEGSRGRGAACSSRPFAWLQYLSLGTFCWRTSQRSLLGGWIEYSASWPRSGMTQNGTAYRLQTLAHRISATGYLSLEQKREIFPTPIVGDSRAAGSRKKRSCLSLTDVVCRGRRRWPPPAASATRPRGNPESLSVQRRILAGKQVALSQTVSGMLNPEFVEWLMGFPSVLTDLYV